MQVQGLRAALLEVRECGAARGPALPPSVEGRGPGELLPLVSAGLLKVREGREHELLQQPAPVGPE
eukprot:68687-Alexandrium_andersonii.AAC.1